MRPPGFGYGFGFAPPPRTLCDDVWLGLIYRALSKYVDVHNTARSAELIAQHNISQIYQDIMNLTPHKIPLAMLMPNHYDDHNVCQDAASLALKTALVNLAQSLRVNISTAEMNHMKKQATKCGTSQLSNEKLIKPKLLAGVATW